MKKGYENLKSRFSTFPPDVQILHTVSDLTKAEHLAAVDRVSATNHVYRAMILLDYIIQDPKWESKLGELLRLREAIGSSLFHSKPFVSIEQAISAALLMEPKAYRALRGKD